MKILTGVRELAQRQALLPSRNHLRSSQSRLAHPRTVRFGWDQARVPDVRAQSSDGGWEALRVLLVRGSVQGLDNPCVTPGRNRCRECRVLACVRREWS